MARADREPQLTPLMLQLVAAYASGKDLQEIADERFVSYSSASQTVGEAKKRLGARHLAHCVVLAQAYGLLSHPTGPDHVVLPLRT